MSKIDFYGDVHWENKGDFINSDVPYVFNFEYVVETENAKPATNKINVAGSGDFSRWKTKPIAVNIANNHILDYRDKGIEHTMQILEENNISFFGAGTLENNYNNPCIIELEQKKIALLGYNDFKTVLDNNVNFNKCALPTEEQIKKDIVFCKKNNVDLIIANVHWGREERSWHNKRQVMIGHLLIDEGVDLVIGHHPHCIQPIEKYKDKYICYSLGNTMFPNLNTNSYYDEKGKNGFKVYTRNLKCGRESLKIRYDINEGDIQVFRLEYKKGRIKQKGEEKFTSVVPNIYSKNFVNELVGYWRRIIILVKSNIFIDGKLINGRAFRKEIEFIKAKKMEKR